MGLSTLKRDIHKPLYSSSSMVKAWKAGYQPIENYGLIGDLHTVALVGMDGSIDFMSFPHFDSPTIFAAILDHEKGGYFKVAPVMEGANCKQLYLTDTNILLTRFLSEQGVAEISDFMPIEDDHAHRIIRRIKSVRGSIKCRMICAPRFDYARVGSSITKKGGSIIFSSQKPGQASLRLHSSVPVKIDFVGKAAVAEFTLGLHETASFILEETHSGHASPIESERYIPESFKNTVNFWRNWVSRSNYKGRWRETINRSALVLKLLTSRTNGSIVAAPTFGLPEELGGVRNWDYRYTWIRDASFTLYGLIRLGYTDEAAAFMKWIEQRCRDLSSFSGSPLQIMYGIDGRKKLTEIELSHFEGYKKSAPVRVGNGAYDQLQLDIYGELMDSVYLYDKYGEAISYDFWTHLVRLVNWVCANWRKKDEGIWEVRGGKQEFLYSRLMCWVAVDRGIRLSQKRSMPAPLHKWFEVRNTIYKEIFENFWDPKKQAFVQSKGSNTMDASNLLMPLVRFISPTDPRWLSTLAAINKELVDDSLVFRYRVGKGASDGLAGEEGTFTMCSFWYVECLSRAGDVDKARFLFDKMLGYANHLGLYAEELGPKGEHLGNFPQAFTHLALISAAYNIDSKLSAQKK